MYFLTYEPTDKTMTDSKHPLTHNDIMELLPWYATGTLSASENRLVADYLEKHPEYQSEVELIQKLQTVQDSELDIPAPDTQRLMHKLDATLEKQTVTSRLQHWLQKLLIPSPLWAAVPIALVLAVTLVWIPQQEKHDQSFQTLSSGDQNTTLQLSVITASDATAATLLPMLEQAAPNARITTLKTGQYQVTFNEVMSPDAVLQIMQKLQNIDRVQDVEILPK